MFTAEGYVERSAYTVVVGGPADDGTPRVGVAAGSPNVLALLDLYDGRTVNVTPTGPAVKVDSSTPRGVYALLLAETEVVHTTGDVPDLLPPPVRGAVY